jgi:hypothetical protein
MERENMSNRTIRCCQTALLVAAVLALGAGMALGQPNVCPDGAPAVGATHTTGLPTTKTCPPQALPGQQYQCTFQVSNADINHCVQNLTFTETAPPGQNPVAVECFQGATAVTLLSWKGDGVTTPPPGSDTCTGTITATAPNNCTASNLSFTDRIDSAGTDRGDGTGTDIYFGLPSAGQASGTVVVPPLVCPTAPECQTATCTLENGCGTAPVGDSTACGDTDQNNCTTAGCEAGVCVQAHVTTPCTALECNTAACNADHICVQTPAGDSTACTDTDGNNCTTAGCELGACVQTHVTTPCTALECNTAACDATHTCVQTPVSDSTACTDTDGVACTTAGCEAGICVQTHISDCVSNEICRTPGFWGTHACPETDCTLESSVCEKTGSQNITQIVLNGFTGTCGPLLICGNNITDTCLDSSSAVEAICVAVKGDSTLQVARQLTAAALNCILSNSADATVGTCTGAGENCADVCAGISVDAVFAACNDPANACATTATVDGTVVNCIEALDCFNNGGTFDIATGTCGASEGTSCHDRDLVNGCFSFNPPGPAGSPKECNTARKDDITIFP